MIKHSGIFSVILAMAACGGESGDTTAGDTTAGDTTAAETMADPTEAPGTTAEPGSTGEPGTTVGDSIASTTGTTGEPGSTGSTGDTTTGEVADCGFDPGLVFARDAEIFQLISADGETCVWLERRDDSLPDMIYKAVPYTLLAFKAGHAGEVAHLTDAAKLTWESTHHNWTDVAEAWDDAVRYRLEDWFGTVGEFENLYGLSAYDEASGELLWGPVELVPFTP
jgi:hypothetical protein